jgi:acetyl-CoA hydrolase
MREIDPGDLDLRDFVRPGDVILIGPSTAEPLRLVEALMAQRAGLGGVTVLLGTSYSDAIQPEHADHIEFVAFGGTGAARRLAKAGVLSIIPVHVSQVPELITSGTLRVDVVLAQLSPGQGAGSPSLGPADLYLGPALSVARTVIAEINDRAPWTYSRRKPDLSKVAVAIRTSRPLAGVEAGPADDIDRAIAGNIARLVPDGAVLQVGVGGVFSALSEALHAHRDLGIHSGTVGDLLVDLSERGVVTNARKSADRGISVVATLLGSQRLFDFVHGNKAVRVDDSGYVHAASTLASIDRLIAINSAVEVDLTGQINSEIAGTSYPGSIGGQVDFVRGANLSKGGRSIIALRAAGRRAGNSGIVSSIRSGIVTTARADADCIVTEFGSAELRGRTIGQRIEAMIAIAPPEMRDQLAQDARTIIGQRGSAQTATH